MSPSLSLTPEYIISAFFTNSFQSVHLVSIAYTLPFSHIYIQAPVRLAEPMWVEQTSHLLGKYIHVILKSTSGNLQVKVIPFCEFVWPLAC